ncbi:MAG: hypothetical protein E7298_13035 [Lachnospiraceae bacterium]|nr:hypothetical protein [Lachnospiraceae bacterium]
MMRITNGMMTSNTKNNININKLNEDRLNTQIATGQVISRPSEDPVVAIRALRLNTNLSQLTQYYKKNIPDAEAWLNVTETALKQTNQIFTNIKENLTTGASDDNTANDRQKILESLKGLRAELYSAGNADYAERTVFTGYRTGESLTFLATDTDLNSEYMIHETFDAKALDTFNYITSDLDDEIEVTQNEINRIRLSYDNIMSLGTPTNITLADGSIIPVTMQSISGKTQAQIDSIYTGAPDNEAYLIPETGELILGKTAATNYATAATAGPATFEYTKNQWNSGDLRPEHYFACTQTTGTPLKKTYFNYDLMDDGTGKMVPDPTKPNFKNQNMEIEISFNQKITINTHANEVYTHDIGRDIDDLLRVTQDVVDAEEKLAAAEKKLAAASDADKATVQKEVDAANKEFAFKKSRMQKMFAEGLDRFDAYADRNNVAIANIGSMQSRLSITKERVADQLQSFKELADNNINAELTESSIDFSNAKLALEAAQLAAGKISQQTLLNYL